MTTKILLIGLTVFTFGTFSYAKDSIPPELECVTKGNCSSSCPGGGKR